MIKPTVVAALLFAGCVGAETDVPSPTCGNVVSEHVAFVPYPWAEYDDEETHVMPNGCTNTRVTHYVFYDGSDSSGSGGSGNLPMDYYARQCQWDACGGPLPDKPGENVTNPDPLR